MAIDDKDVLDIDFSGEKNLTIEAQRGVLRLPRLMRIRGGIRLLLGRLPTSQEIEDRRQRARSKSLSPAYGDESIRPYLDKVLTRRGTEQRRQAIEEREQKMYHPTPYQKAINYLKTIFR